MEKIVDKSIMGKIIVITVFFVSIYSFSFAETIYLKSGQKIEGKIIEKTDKYIKIDFQGVPLIYYFEDIDKIGEEVMKHWDKEKGLIVAIEPSEVREEEGIRIANYKPQGSDLTLVDFNSKDCPVIIRYPQQWYAREEFKTDGTVYSLFLSREPIRSASDLFLVGVTVNYFKDYFLDVDWDSLVSRVTNDYEKSGFLVVDIKNKEINGHQAIFRSLKNQSITVINQTVKVNNSLLNLTLEAPNEDYQSYGNIFKEILDSVQIKQ